jgi:uncharacterized protein
MAGQPAPGAGLEGWYDYNPDYDPHKYDAGLAPGATFGQWISALSRNYAITGDEATREKVLRLNRMYAQAISADYYKNNRFPAYCYDKLVCGLIDSHTYANDPQAFDILDRTTDVARPQLPARALDRDKQSLWRIGKDESWAWDESYTLPENLFLAYERGAGERYRRMAFQYLDDETFFEPLSRGQDVLAGKHAYSYVNALSSGMQAYMVGGSSMHLKAVKNAFTLLQEQSYATGGWGPDEKLLAQNTGELGESLDKTHHSFETPCGAYAHLKVTRYLLRVTGDSRYGDSMESVMYNTVLGAKPLQSDGQAFYYADYNAKGKRVYSDHRWACCSGTLPQVAAGYRINAYFQGPKAVYVNLYIPSTLKWTEGKAQFTLVQTSKYPLESHIAFELKASRPTQMTLNFRIPAWAEGATLHVNGEAIDGVTAGSFAAVGRTWKDGDRIELELPLAMRVQAVDASHSDTMALLRGPLVLFATNEPTPPPATAWHWEPKQLHGHPKPKATPKAAASAPVALASTIPAVTKQQLLEAKQTSPHEWQMMTDGGAIILTPFTELGDRNYSTYLKTS